MRTQVMHESVTGVPWLEYYPTDSSRPKRHEIESFPFMIGRIESADLQIESSRVSREHAVILHDSELYSVRDLGSTNGTFLNGRRIDESPLRAGDVLVIADVELTFYEGEAKVAQRAVTQVMDTPTTDTRSSSPDFVRQVRRMHESLTNRSIDPLFQPLVELPEGNLVGFQSLVDTEDSAARTQRVLQAAECRLTERFFDLHRLVAAEHSVELPRRGMLLLALQTSEVGAEWLDRSLRRLLDVIDDRHQVVMQIPDSAVCDIPYFREFLALLKDLQIRSAYDGFNGGEAQVSDLADIAPDLLILSQALVRGIPRSSGGQRQVQSIVRAADNIGAGVIATDVNTDVEAEVVGELGCQFGIGDHYGVAQPIAALASGPMAAM